MFEKEAEEYTYFVKSTKERWKCDKIFYADIELAYQKGAEFGYNKANEWHDLRKNPNDLPKECKGKLYLVNIYSDSQLKFRYAVDYPTSYGKGYKHKDLRIAYLAGAEPREKQIQIDAEQIRALQKQNGELTDRVKELEEELTLTNNECKDMREELKQRIRENQKLCEQIEKMKCCGNCKYNSYWGNELHCNYGLKEALQKDKLVECKNMDKWEIKEND